MKTLEMPALKKGALVKVYQQHITDQGLEGYARLVSQEMDGGDEEGGYYWNVRFIGPRGHHEVQTYPRWVHARHITSARV